MHTYQYARDARRRSWQQTARRRTEDTWNLLHAYVRRASCEFLCERLLSGERFNVLAALGAFRTTHSTISNRVDLNMIRERLNLKIKQNIVLHCYTWWLIAITFLYFIGKLIVSNNAEVLNRYDFFPANQFFFQNKFIRYYIF